VGKFRRYHLNQGTTGQALAAADWWDPIRLRRV
jgi:hypothetical protein